jgi:hypothetical protein
MRHLPYFVVASAISASLFACGSDRGSSFETTPSSNEPQGEPDKKEAPAGSLGSSTGGAPASSSSSGGETCAATVAKATRAEVDVVVVIDTSGSMDEETNQVKQNINAFAQSIGNTGLDYNVIMVAAKPQKIFGFPSGNGICVPPPLGGADCADNPPKFHHLNATVGSTDSLQILLDKYSQYSAWLRPTAYKVFIEVTDDNSKLTYDAFDKQLLAKDPAQFGTASSRRYIFNAICGYKRSTPVLSADKCASAVNTGDQYQHLSQLTGGTVDAVCETSYASVFDNIAKGLVSKLGCEFGFPKSEAGKQADPDTVAITYTPGDGGPSKPLTQVTDASKCGGNPDGWYYDDAKNPSQILFCPSTCNGPGSDTAGKLEVAVGCKTPAPK